MSWLMYLSYDYRMVHKHAVMTTNALTRRGWKVTLIHTRGAPFEATPVREVCRIPVGSGVKGVRGIWHAEREMCKVMADMKPPVVYARQHWFGILPPLEARKLRIPYIAEFNGLRYWGYWRQSQKGTGLPKALLISWLEKVTAHLSTALVAPSKLLAKRLKEMVKGKRPVFVVPNGVDTEIFKPMPHSAARELLGLPNEALYIVYAGRLEPWQGVDVLLQAFAYLIARFPEFGKCYLLVVGGRDEPNKECYPELARQLGIADKTLFVPFVPYEQSALWIAAADVCVAPYLPSYCEHGGGSPLKLYAYLSCERPVVLSDLGDFVDADLVRTNGAGLLVPPGDPKALADALATLLSARDLREEMGKLGRKAILNGYTWDHNAKRIEGILLDLLSNKPPDTQGMQIS